MSKNKNPKIRENYCSGISEDALKFKKFKKIDVKKKEKKTK